MTPLARALSLASLACLALITLASPGATRMWATPWTLALWAALLLPALALGLRAFDLRTPLALPSRAWLGGALAAAGVVVASALVSPYRQLSLRWSAPLLGGLALFFVAFDWLHAPPDRTAARRAWLAQTALLGGFAVGVVSLGLWGEVIIRAGWREAIAARNAFPLGHSNYTAGLALLMLPLAASGIWRHRGGWRIIAGATAGLALAMLFSSGSRGGLIGLAALAAVALGLAPLTRKSKWRLAAAAAAAGLVFIVANPRTRATFTGGADRHLVAASTVQRAAMFSAGRSMGADRPLLGWGPGTTPLAYPRYRAGLEGGAENVLQLHSTPVHVWAELGAAGIGCLLVFSFLVFRHRRRSPVAALTFAGYAAFALTDWQLDIPVFAAALATGAALLAPACHLMDDKPKPTARFALGACALLGVAVIGIFGRRDPPP
jgi:O-antigen ligase